MPEYDKESARALVGQMIDELSARGQTLFVRVNRLETGLTGFDLEAVTRPGLYGILLPKVETPADVVEADVLLRYFERKAGMELNTVCIDPGLETAQGIRMAYEIAMASERVGHMGGDTARSVGYRWTLEGAETLYLRSKVLVDARAAGIQWPVSGGWFDIRDLDGLRFWANNIKALGYTGMHLIHPSHVPIVNEIFTPTAEEIAHWQGLLAAMDRSRRGGHRRRNLRRRHGGRGPRGNRQSHAGNVPEAGAGVEKSPLPTWGEGAAWTLQQQAAILSPLMGEG